MTTPKTFNPQCLADLNAYEDEAELLRKEKSQIMAAAKKREKERAEGKEYNEAEAKVRVSRIADFSRRLQPLHEKFKALLSKWGPEEIKLARLERKKQAAQARVKGRKDPGRPEGGPGRGTDRRSPAPDEGQ